MEAQLEGRFSAHKASTPSFAEGDELDWNVLTERFRQIDRLMANGVAVDHLDFLSSGFGELHDIGKLSTAYGDDALFMLFNDAVDRLDRTAAELEEFVVANRMTLALIESRGDRLDRLNRDNQDTIDAILGDRKRA